MNGITIGPLMFAADRLAAALGIVTFMILSTIFAMRVDRKIADWSNHTLLAGLIAARAGHVLKHFDSFAREPRQVFAIWQGGFSLFWGMVAVLVVAALHIRSLRIGLATALTLGLSLFIWNLTDQLSMAAAAQPAPTETMAQLEGPPLSLAQARSKPVVVNLWATWCPPCRHELPMLAEVAGSRNDVVFYFADQGEDAESVRRYLDQQHLAPAHVLLDREMALPRHYETPGIPVTLFLRADGTLMNAHLGEISRAVLNDEIARLMAKP